jgi:hypothetical protein
MPIQWCSHFSTQVPVTAITWQPFLTTSIVEMSDGARRWLKGQTFWKRERADTIVIVPTLHRIFLHGLCVAKRQSASWEDSTQWISIAKYSQVVCWCSGLRTFYFTKFDTVTSKFRDRCRRIWVRSRGWWVGFLHSNVVTFPVSQSLSRDVSASGLFRASQLQCAVHFVLPRRTSFKFHLYDLKTTECYFVMPKSVCILLQTNLLYFNAFCVYFIICLWYLTSSGN